MHHAFRRLPLTAKLLLIGIIPLILLIYISIHIYTEKTQRLHLLGNYIQRIRQGATINQLIDYLQKERKLSFDYAMKKEGYPALLRQRPLTDSTINQLERGALTEFTTYTFLDKLEQMRRGVDSQALSPDLVMHYYTTAIYRLNTLNAVSPGTEVYLQPVYKDLIAQKLLSVLITNLGIIRSNIYNVLYTRKYMIETLMGTVGVHDVYKTYETEFLLKASPAAILKYKQALNDPSLKATVDYIDNLFKRFSFDSTYNSESWWTVSEKGMNQLTKLEDDISREVDRGTNAILKNERTARNRGLIFLVIALVAGITIVAYTIAVITKTLKEMKLAAQQIAKGCSVPPLQITSNDAIGDLARSISEIEANNKLLANAADAIGKGDFTVRVDPRSKEDILGNAVARMKENLMHFSRVNQENNEQLSQLAEKYKTIFYKSPLPKWIYDPDTLKFVEVNEAAVKHYGYTQDEFLNMTVKDIRPPKEHEQLLDNVALLNKGLSPLERYWHHRKKDGEIITVDVKAYFFDYNKRKARMVVINDVTEKLRNEERLKQSHEELRELASHLQNIREEERANMAREVHDVLGQQITCIKMDISWLTKQIDSKDPSINQKINEVLELIDRTAITIRKIASELRPSILDDFGLIEAMEWQSHEFEKRSGIKIKFNSSVSGALIPENITTGLFRIYQESLTNVNRHAAATEVSASVEVKNNNLIMTISDNGKGFNVADSRQKKTLGLLGMKERSTMMRGKYELSSEPGKGTVVSVTVPLQ